jgi:hypothetical protein
MKKKYLFYSKSLFLVLIIIFALWGCSSEGGKEEEPEKSKIQVLWEGTPEDVVAILINQPTEEQMKDFPPAERLIIEESPEKFLLIPAEKVEEIVVWRLEFDGTNFVRSQEVYNNYDPDDDYVLEIEVIRPEGGPHYEISFIADHGETNYYVAYDGKEGNPNIEYIFFEK